MENNHVMAEHTAKELETLITNDILKGYYCHFAKVEAVLSDVLLAIQKKKPFTYEQDCTLRANGYTEGIIAHWYYPKCKDFKIIR